jgi:hypothetical protein
MEARQASGARPVAHGTVRGPATPARSLPRRWADWLIAGLVLVALPVYLRLGRGLIPMEDEWSLVQTRLDGGADVYLEPHNEHLLAVPIAVFKALFATVGIDRFWPYLLVVVVAHLLAVVLLYAIARRALRPELAVAITLPFVFFGPGWELSLFPINIGFLGSLVAALGVMLLLERRKMWAQAACALLLMVALACSSLGIALAAGMLAERLWDRKRPRRLWVVALPVALYGLWYVVYNIPPARQGPIEVLEAPWFIVRTAAGAVGAIVGLPAGNETASSPLHGAIQLADTLLLAAALGALVVVHVRAGRPTPRLVFLLVMLATFWCMLGLSRAYTDGPFASRYIAPAAFLIALIVVEVAAGRRIPARLVPIAAGLALAAATLNAHWLREDAANRRAAAATLASQLGAMELARDRLEESGRLSPQTTQQRFRPERRRPTAIVADAYFPAIDRLGSSSAYTLEEIAAAPEPARAAADDVLLRAYAVRPAPYTQETRAFIDRLRSAAGGRLRIVSVRGTRTALASGCERIAPRGAAPVLVDVRLPARGVLVRSSSESRIESSLRRFARGFSGTSRLAGTGGSTALLVPRDASDRPWSARITGTRALVVC